MTVISFIEQEVSEKGVDMSEESHEHILIKKAHKYLVKRTQCPPENFEYDWRSGAWRHIETNEFYARCSDRRPPQTKKADVETGEDQKGE